MNNLDKENNLPKIYHITGIIAFIYAVILLVFAIYKEFFYVDGTWLHGLTTNGVAVLINLIWIGILFVFKQFLNKILHHSKSNLLINIYLIFLGITTISVVSVLYESVKVYLSLEDTNNFNALTSFASASISGFIFLVISNFVIILICILLGNQIRKIDIIESKLFQFIGYTFITYGIISLLTSINIIDSDIYQLLAKVVLTILIGLILKKVYNMNYATLYSLREFDKTKNLENSKPKSQNSLEQEMETIKSDQVSTKKEGVFKEESKKTNFQKEELPITNLNEFEDKELVLSYYENLPKEELNRLEHIVVKKFNQDLTKEQKTNLVLQHIIENKLYDHRRFLPQ